MVTINTPAASSLLPAQGNQIGQNKPDAQDSRNTFNIHSDKVDLNSSVTSKYGSASEVLKNFDPQAVVDNVSGPLEQAMKRAAAGGASEEELNNMRAAAEKGVNQGFSDAQDIIRGLGLMSDDLAGVINGAKDDIMSRLAAFGEGLSDLPGADTAQNVAATGMRAMQSRQDSFSFSVTTAEGDVVTINAGRQQSMELEMLEQNSENAQSLTASWQDQWSQSFSMTVDGDLNDEEMAAIEALMEKVSDVADTFFSGQYEAAFEKAQKLGLNSDALASMDLDLTQKTVAVAEYSAMSSGQMGSGQNARNDWVMPIKQYAQGLADLQNSQSSLLAPDAWLEALSNHPKQNSAMIDFAESVFKSLAE